MLNRNPFLFACVEPPSQPLLLKQNEVTRSSFTISWQKPTSDGQESINSYEVHYRELPNGNFSFTLRSATVSKITTDKKLTRYEVKVRAVNDAGKSEFSNTIQVMTNDCKCLAF